MKKVEILTDSKLKDSELKRLYIMDSTTMYLFKTILEGFGQIKGKAGSKHIRSSKPAKVYPA